LNVYGVNNVNQTEIHRAEPLITGPRFFEVKLRLKSLKKITRYYCSNPDLTEGVILRSEVHKLKSV